MLAKKNKNNLHDLIMDQIQDVEACLVSFESFMRAATTPETVVQTLRSLSVGVGQLENAADLSLRRMIDSLADASFLPSTRADLIDVATNCDRVANKCEHVSMMMVHQKFRFPQSMNEELTEILVLTHDEFEMLKTAIDRLFSNIGDLLKNHKILDEIRAKESQVDVIEQRLYDNVFDMDLTLAEKMQCTQFLEQLCDISDVIENIADKIQIMLITRKA